MTMPGIRSLLTWIFHQGAGARNAGGRPATAHATVDEQGPPQFPFP